MTVPYEKIKEAAKGYEQDMTRFLRDIVKFPGESCGEKEHIDRIAEEMRKLDFDKVEIDPMGNVLGYMGTGKTLIGFFDFFVRYCHENHSYILYNVLLIQTAPDDILIAFRVRVAFCREDQDL